MCKDIVTEPTLLPLRNEQLPRGTTLSNDLRLDISCTGFYSALYKTFLHVRVSHPNNLSNVGRPLDRMSGRLINPTTGELAPEAANFVKRLLAKLCQSYPNVLGYVFCS